MVKATVTARAEVKRGPQSWNYIYVFLGFFLTVEGNFIQMFDLPSTARVLLYLVVGAITVYLFLGNRWFQNKLTGLKSSYEEKWR